MTPSLAEFAQGISYADLQHPLCAAFGSCDDSEALPTKDVIDKVARIFEYPTIDVPSRVNLAPRLPPASLVPCR